MTADFMTAVISIYKLLALPLGIIALGYIGVCLVNWWDRRH